MSRFVAVFGAVLLLYTGWSCASRAPRPGTGVKTAPDVRTDTEAKAPAPPPVAEPCVAVDASREPEGLAAERAWLHQRFPGWRMKSQSLDHGDKGVFDRLVVLDAGGAEHAVCFDITAWFGKF